MNKRRSFLQRLTIAIFGGLTLSFRSKDMQKPTQLEGPFLHMVFFWLKEPGDQQARDKFLAALNKFIDSSKEITRAHIGTPADTDRPVIDNSYTYSLVVSFDSKAKHDIYQEDPMHKEFIATAENLWSKVQVYDSELL